MSPTRRIIDRLTAENTRILDAAAAPNPTAQAVHERLNVLPANDAKIAELSRQLAPGQS